MNDDERWRGFKNADTGGRSSDDGEGVLEKLGVLKFVLIDGRGSEANAEDDEDDGKVEVVLREEEEADTAGTVDGSEREDAEEERDKEVGARGARSLSRENR